MKALFFGFASLPEDEGGIVIGDLQGIYLCIHELQQNPQNVKMFPNDLGAK